MRTVVIDIHIFYDETFSKFNSYHIALIRSFFRHTSVSTSSTDIAVAGIAADMEVPGAHGGRNGGRQGG